QERGVRGGHAHGDRRRALVLENDGLLDERTDRDGAEVDPCAAARYPDTVDAPELAPHVLERVLACAAWQREGDCEQPCDVPSHPIVLRHASSVLRVHIGGPWAGRLQLGSGPPSMLQPDDLSKCMASERKRGSRSRSRT